MRVLWIDQANYDLVEVAYFDVYPDRTTANFGGSWSNYPYYNSGECQPQALRTHVRVLTQRLCRRADVNANTRLVLCVTGAVAVTSIEYGLFMLRVNLPSDTPTRATSHGQQYRHRDVMTSRNSYDKCPSLEEYCSC